MSPPRTVTLLVVATALTVYGIETAIAPVSKFSAVSLQQHLPFTVLKLTDRASGYERFTGGCNSTYRLRY